jgi:hypothetical protein
MLVRLPNVVGITPAPFDPDTYVMEAAAFDDEETGVAGSPNGSAAPSRSQSAVGATKVKSEKKSKSKKSRDDDAMSESDADADDNEGEGIAASQGVKIEGSPLGSSSTGGGGGEGKAVRLSVENMIRWRQRTDPVTGAVTRESNARLVRFADGSQFLYLGGETFQVNEAPLKADRNLLLQTMEGVEGAKRSVGKFGKMIKFRVTGIHSASHQKLKAAISMAHVQRPKIKRRYDMTAPRRHARSNASACSSSSPPRSSDSTLTWTWRCRPCSIWSATTPRRSSAAKARPCCSAPCATSTRGG